MEGLESRQLLSAAVAATNTLLSPNIETAVYGQAVTFTATVTAAKGSPTGTVSFEDGSTLLGIATVNASTHHAALTTSILPIGTHTVTAVYSGAKNFSGSTSSAVTETVVYTDTTTTVTATSANASLGQNETFTATVTATANGTPVTAGIVTFTSSDGTTLGTSGVNSAGQATFSEYNWFTGSFTVTASYSAFSNYSSSDGSTTVNISLPTLITPPTDKNNDGLQMAIVTPGAGPGTAKVGQAIEVNYTGYLSDGTKFDSSLNAGRTPFIFALGETVSGGGSSVITGWEEGIPGMKVGETRVLVIPPALAYGASGQGTIPGNATLTFIIQLLAINVPRVQILAGANQSLVMANNQAPSQFFGTDFGIVPLGEQSEASEFTINNADQAFNLSFTGDQDVELSGADPADFLLTEPASGSDTFTIAFAPTQKGTRTATVNILTNDPALPDFTFTVTGIGT
jgi:hypothetical protein